MVDFSGWEMPLSYGSQLEEHMAVRSKAGIFDVSHMAVFSLSGNNVEKYLSYICANNVAKIKDKNKALYGTILNHEGGILDDLIVYSCEGKYWIVSNCGTRDKNTQWFNEQAKKFSVTVELLKDFCIIALQGPQANDLVTEIVQTDSPTQLSAFEVMGFNDGLIARTGYTGEDGFEFIVPSVMGTNIWDKALAMGISPVGLAARDTLRLEAGLNLYGNDMDESVHPFESGLGWTVDMSDPDRDFIGKEALEKIDQHSCKKTDRCFIDRKRRLETWLSIKKRRWRGNYTQWQLFPCIAKKHWTCSS
jgi:aminomethyltransferase